MNAYSFTSEKYYFVYYTIKFWKLYSTWINSLLPSFLLTFRFSWMLIFYVFVGGGTPPPPPQGGGMGASRPAPSLLYIILLIYIWIMYFNYEFYGKYMKIVHYATRVRRGRFTPECAPINHYSVCEIAIYRLVTKNIITGLIQGALISIILAMQF